MNSAPPPNSLINPNAASIENESAGDDQQDVDNGAPAYLLKSLYFVTFIKEFLTERRFS